jgi:hypothetical protein
MSGLLGTRASLQYDLSLLIQIAVLLLLLLGYKYVREGKLRRHGLTMSAAVTLHVASIILIMVPSLVIHFGVLFTDVTSPGVIITWIHLPIGIYAAYVGISIVVNWRFRSESLCMRKANMMKPLLVLWTIALFLGIAFYVYYYL